MLLRRSLVLVLVLGLTIACDKTDNASPSASAAATPPAQTPTPEQAAKILSGCLVTLDAVDIAMGLGVTVDEAQALGDIHEVKIGPDGGLVVDRLGQGVPVHVVGFVPKYQMFEIDRPVQGWISAKAFLKREPDPTLCTGKALPEQVAKLDGPCNEERNIVCENNGACCEGFCVDTIYCPSYKEEGELCFDFTTTIKCARGLRCCDDQCAKPDDEGECPKSSKRKRKR